MNQHVHAWSTAVLAGAGAVVAQAAERPAVAWTTIVLALISVLTLWVRGYWSNQHAMTEAKFLRRENDRLRARLDGRGRPPSS